MVLFIASLRFSGAEVMRARCINRMPVFSTLTAWSNWAAASCRKLPTKGNCVIVGRGAPYLLRERGDAFHVFLYAPYAEKLRRLREEGSRIPGDPEELLNTVDRDRIVFVKRYFHADWPTRSLYHLMVNTAVGNEIVLATILDTIRRMEKHPTTSITSFPNQGEQAAT